MKRSRKRNVQIGEKSLSIALFFILLVGFLIALSILLKVFLLFKTAKFDGEHQFILELHHDTKKQLLSFDPDTGSAVIASLNGTTTSTLGNYAGIPVDSIVTTDEGYDSLYTLAQRFLFHPPQNLPLNIVDRVRLFLFVNSIKPTSITEDTLQMGEGVDDKKLMQLFLDHTAYTENASIAVVNGSGVSGLGNRVAEYLSHIGLDVISVTSASQMQEKSSIVYAGKEGYTVKRLMRIFAIPVQQSNAPMLSDITVIIGKDAAGKF